MDPIHENPFAALTLIAAPAVLTNASSLLALGTSNRFARAVDRQRQLSKLMDGDTHEMDSETAALHMRQLRRTEARAQLVLRALTSIYLSLGSFAAAALVSLLGVFVGAGYPFLSDAVRLLALCCGFLGVSGLVTGSLLLVRETRMTLAGLREEAEFYGQRFEAKHHLPPSPATIQDAR